jgi:hypothetical protein
MQLTPREFDKLVVYMLAEVALKRKASSTIRKPSRSSRPPPSMARAPARRSRK